MQQMRDLMRVRCPAEYKAAGRRHRKGKKMENLELEKIANEVRKGIVTAVHSAKSGHPGGSLSAADILTYLYFEEMNVDPKNPKMADRDRFVLSKGHVAPALYSVLAQKGFIPGGGFKDVTSYRFLPAGTSGYETYTGYRHVERFPGTGLFCSSRNGTGS